jgi:apolipoprotein N-acyltransferase
MPVTSRKEPKMPPGKSSKKSGRKNVPDLSAQASEETPNFFKRFAPSFMSILSGCVLGLSAPGIDIWFTAWFGLAPLLLLIATSETVWIAAWRGLLFGTCYNLVYFNWLLGLQPLDWLGFNWFQGALVSMFAVAFVATHQGILISLFAAITRLIPTQGVLYPEYNKNSWKIPALLVIPVLWTFAVNKIGNAHFLLGVPWSMLEYSQYKQLPVIQICSSVGGIGLGFLMVMANTSLAVFIATFFFNKANTQLNAPNRIQALHQFLVMGLLIACAIFYGFWQSSKKQPQATTKTSVLQANINIDMQKTVHKYTLHELLDDYTRLTVQSPAGLCVWTESALPTYLNNEKATREYLMDLAKLHHLDMVVGSMDQSAEGKPYNSAYGITAGGNILSEVYHKRYLVPYGEYTPAPARCFPEWILRLTNTPAGGGFESGVSPVVLDLDCGKVGPLICFETLSPELVSSSVRKGAQLLVNISDLAWFHKSICGEQMLAFATLRAVENGRYMVFAANTGPSAIIDPAGLVTTRSALGKERVLTGSSAFIKDNTLFSQWFIF